MRKINLENYHFDGVDEKGEPKKFPYNMRGNLIAVLFQRELNLNGVELLERDDLARKIRDCKGNEILLEGSEYEKVKQAVDTFTGYGQHDVKFVRRVLEAPEVKVKEDK